MSARTSSVSEPILPLARGAVPVWLSDGADTGDSETFLRTVLSRFTGVGGPELEIARGEQGKPFLVNAPHPRQFSLGHSGDRLVLALARDASVGVDLEVHDPQRQVMPLARRFFSRVEHEDLDALAEEACRQRFYDLWTLKEARVKALGGSLASELETTGFRIDDSAPGLPGICPQPASPDDFYGLLVAPPGYSLAICVLSPPRCPPRIKLFSGSETDDARPLPVQLRAGSPIDHG